MTVGVSYQDVVIDLVRPSRRQGDIDWWRRSRGDARIAPRVLGFRHAGLFEIRPDEVKQVLASSGHALGTVGKSENYPAIRDG